VNIYRNSTVSSFDYCVDNLGNFSYLFIYLKSKDDGFNKYANEDFAHAVGISSFGSTKNNVIEITSNEIETFNPKLEIINNLLVCTGKYKFQGEPSAAYFANKKVGLFLLAIDGGSGALKTKSYEYFSPEIHKKLSYKDKGYTSEFAGQKTYTTYKTLLIGGFLYQIKLRTLDNDYEDCQGKEILIYKYDSNNELEWMKIIPRSTFKELAAVNYFVDNKLNLLYYEDPQNLENFPNTETYDPLKYKMAKSAKKSILVSASIDEKGNITRKKVEMNCELPIMDKENYDKTYIHKKNAFIIPIKLSSTKLRYDILKIN
jgi:hypothetical protein